jgi:MFS family permease
MRILSWAMAAVLLVLAVGAATGSPVAVVALVVAAVVTVSTNGLAFTAVAERAGQAWAGRALGLQNTAQNITAALTPPATAAVITAVGPRSGYAAAFGLIVVVPVLAAAAIPVRSEPGRTGPDRTGQPERA